MANKALAVIVSVNGQAASKLIYAVVQVGFTEEAGGVWGCYVTVYDIDPAAPAATIKATIEAAIKATLEAEPYKMVFGVLDTVRCLTEMV